MLPGLPDWQLQYWPDERLREVAIAAEIEVTHVSSSTQSSYCCARASLATADPECPIRYSHQ